MSGDVQPRKRKDKKKRKDDALPVEEPYRGTTASFGEGDVFLHTHHEHGTGGHWCAKVVFFSLLAVLITLIGLIILENRGLSDLEASSVQSQYSGVLEGWIEDAPDDDHHDEHTLDLKHHDEDEEDHHLELEDDDHEVDEDDEDHDNGDDEHEGESEENDAEDDDEQSNEDLDQEDQTQEDLDNEDQDDESDNYNENETEEQDDDENEQKDYSKQQESAENYEQKDSAENDDDEEENLSQLDNEDQSEQSLEDKDDAENEESQENQDDEDEHDDEHDDDDDHDEDDDDEETEIEHIEEEPTDVEPISVELPALPEPDDDDDDNKAEEETSLEDQSADDDGDDDEFLEHDDLEEDAPVVERITAPLGKPFQEVEEEDSTEAPPVDTLADEEEYERRQEELRREEEMASHKDGGDSLDDEWPGEPADSFWRERLDSAEREMRQGSWTAAVEKASATQLSSSARARWIIAKAYDGMAEQKRDNKLLSRSITAYLELLKMNEKLSNEKLLEITNRTLDRIQFRGIYLNAEPVHRLLIRRFPNNPGYRNNLTISFLMANRNDLAAESLKDTLKLWPNDRVALAHYGFIMKTHYNKIEEAVTLFQKALEGDTGPANEPRFYYHLGDSLLLLGRYSEAHEVHKRGAKLGHFLSPAQRSLYNVERLKSRPWWNIDQTPYARMARALEKSWKEILKEGEEARALYVQEKEGLREKGEWSQLDLFLRGREVPDRCIRAPVTCSIVKSEAAAVACRRGQIKFSSMEPGTHVRPHVGPTNCRLRMHLALSNTKDTYLRVDKETRQWQVGKVLMFDDSFEHEVWHNGTGSRLVLIVDVWHPDLIAQERRTLPSI